MQVENGGSASLQETGVPEGFPEDNMSIGSSNDDSVTAAAVFRHLGANNKAETFYPIL